MTLDVHIYMIYLQHLESGLMEVISPPSEFYPDLAGLRKTLGKNISPDKVFWILNIEFQSQGTIWKG